VVAAAGAYIGAVCRGGWRPARPQQIGL
jgi:hypothetical protein